MKSWKTTNKWKLFCITVMYQAWLLRAWKTSQMVYLNNINFYHQTLKCSIMVTVLICTSPSLPTSLHQNYNTFNTSENILKGGKRWKLSMWHWHAGIFSVTVFRISQFMQDVLLRGWTLTLVSPNTKNYWHVSHTLLIYSIPPIQQWVSSLVTIA
jgi:hypothetical protein